MANRLTLGIRNAGKHSYDTFGWYLASSKHGGKKRKEVLVDIPYADGVLDFTKTLGAACYENRELEYVFFKRFSSTEAMVDGTNKFEEWFWCIPDSYDNDLYDETMAGGLWKHPQPITVEHEFNNLSLIATVTVTFRVDPDFT